jgi:hypothetical protein
MHGKDQDIRHDCLLNSLGLTRSSTKSSIIDLKVKVIVYRLSQNSNHFYNWVMSNVYFKKKIT